MCVCACGSVRILDRKKFVVAQADTPFEEESGLPRLKKSLDYNVRPAPPAR